MFIVAGPPGGGKSSLFALSGFADRMFNADDRAAQLNGGSYETIPTSLRDAVNREFEEFVHANIRAGVSFALETTLRSSVTFDQANLARENGFRVLMFYVALDTVERHIERVVRRATRGGHSASENTLRRIYASSLRNLRTALIPEERAGSKSSESMTTPLLRAARNWFWRYGVVESLGLRKSFRPGCEWRLAGPFRRSDTTNGL